MDTTKKYRNGDPLKLHLKTDSPAFVALGAMDTALYAAGGRAHKPLSMAKVSWFTPQPFCLSHLVALLPKPQVQILDLAQPRDRPYKPRTLPVYFLSGPWGL